MIRRAATTISAVAVLATAGVLAAPAAGAAPATPDAKPLLTVTYAVTGTTTVAKSGLVVPFAPTTITNGLLSNGTFTSNLPLAPVKVSYLAYGFLPAKATVVFTAVRPAKGALITGDAGLTVTATAQYVVSLRNVSFGGTDAAVGPNCQTTRPVVVTVATPAGQSFDIGNGGTLAGTYDIGNFQNCGNAQKLLNDLVPGPGNTISLQLSDGQIQQKAAAVVSPR